MRQPNKRNNDAPRRRSRPDNIQKFKVAQAGPLLEVAGTILKDHTPTKVKSMLRHHQLAVNGTPSSQYDRPVQAGDELWVNFDGSFHIFSHPKIKIVYDDDDIMVIDKGYGMLSTAAGKVRDDTVFSVLRNFVKEADEKAHIYVVHRLDRDTSGLMILARTAKARDKMVRNWNAMVPQRKYEAIVEGRMEEDKGHVINYLRNSGNYEVISSDDPDDGGEKATTHYITLERGERNSHVLLWLHVGHKNQLRVHMKDLGHPISGDRKYGGHANAIHRLALHATHITLVHPVTGKEMTFESPMPKEFEKLMQ